MCRPFDYAEVDLGEMLREDWEDDLKDYGIWMIQQEHGNIYPQKSLDLWPDDQWPPLTPLGKTLTAKMDFISDIVESQADGNLTLAKLRLEEICKADALPVTKSLQDRLPRNIVSLFDAEIQAIQSQAKDIAALGIGAIKLATQEKDGKSFAHLQLELHDFGARVGVGGFTVQDVLHAARGFLDVWLEEGQHVYVKAYHVDFFLYASERYNEDLENFKL
jgi:hypothetical protein